MHPFLRPLRRTGLQHECYKTKSSLPSYITTTNIVGKEVHVHVSSGQKMSFNDWWLRANCTKGGSMVGRSSSSTLTPVATFFSSDAVTVTWNDGHVSEFPLEWLLRHHSTLMASHFSVDTHFWDSSSFSVDHQPEAEIPLPVVSYNKNIDQEVLPKMVKFLSKFGFGVINKVPPEDEVLKSIKASFCGDTVYESHIWGDYWDFEVNAQEVSDDIVDSSLTGCSLPLHVDGTYMPETPGLQFFQIPKFKGQGGQNPILDGWKVARDLAQKEPEIFYFLTSYPFEWQFISRTTLQVATGPIIKLDSQQQVEQVRFNDLDRVAPPSGTSKEVLQLYYKSLKFVLEAFSDPKNQVSLQLFPDKVLVTNNWRTLHGRSPFVGKRSLRGAYIKMDRFNQLKKIYQD
eukprot:TRINITY_DN533_c0_g1_i6.p1 TRINITY_DN533_c0_g1~~TRINITY_DN533_c0_g1_i6.p1  ORF type:complete len:400 (+),score=73.06 TRINITY_DN533_c0_g1_i6:352-1551(+)